MQHRLPLAFVLALLSACDGGAERCVAGMTIECACLGGARGVQTCDADGAYGACECPTTDGGAMSTDAGPRDASASADAGTDAGADAGSDAGSCPIYAGLVADQPSAWSAAGEIGIPAGTALCVALGVGADHVCDYEELRRAELAGELAGVAPPQTFWVHRLTTVDIAGVPSAPGPGGRCNEWTFTGNHIADGEYAEVGAGGTLTYFFDDDTVYTLDPADGHARPGALDCGGVMRAIPCCLPACP